MIFCEHSPGGMYIWKKVQDVISLCHYLASMRVAKVTQGLRTSSAWRRGLSGECVCLCGGLICFVAEVRVRGWWSLDDLRAVAPGFGLALGEGQPGRLRGHLLRVPRREALGHLLHCRRGRSGVCDFNW